MTYYLLSVIGNEADNATRADEDMQRLYAQVSAFNQDLMESKAFVFAGGLHPTSTATVVRATGGEVVVTDGPFAETREVLGGVWIVEADDLDAALEWGRKGAAACEGIVEVRPFADAGLSA